MPLSQIDLDLPHTLLPQADEVLERFFYWLKKRGEDCWRRDKEPGRHLTPFWVYICMSPQAPSKSVCSFGVTRHASVNPRVHAYTRGKQGYLQAAHRLLRAFITAPPAAPPPPTVVRATFDGAEYGRDYLQMKKGHHVILRTPPNGVPAEGWAYGLLLETNVSGWFPPSYVTESQAMLRNDGLV